MIYIIINNCYNDSIVCHWSHSIFSISTGQQAWIGWETLMYVDEGPWPWKHNAIEIWPKWPANDVMNLRCKALTPKEQTSLNLGQFRQITYYIN